MGWLSDRYSRVGPGIEKNAPKKTGAALFFDIWGREFFELVKLNAIFLLFCIPIVTIPAALTAMSRIVVSMVRDEPIFMWTEFRKTFRAEFVRSSISGALLAVAFFISFFSLQLYYQLTAQSVLYWVPLSVVGGLMLLLLSFTFYLFPMLALIDLPLKTLLRNSALLACLCLPKNLLALAIGSISALLFILLFPISLLAGLLGVFAFLNLAFTFIAYSGIRKYVLKDE